MPIDHSEVEIGGIYSAGDHHIRKVIDIQEDEDGNKKVVESGDTIPIYAILLPKSGRGSTTHLNIGIVDRFC